MRKYFIALFVTVLPFAGFSQSRFFVNLNGGIDFTANKYYNYNNYEIFQNSGAEFSYGADLGFKFSDKVRFRVESRFGSYSYGQYYSGTDLEKTEMTLDYFDINPRLDFRVFSRGRFEVFVSPGLRLEYISNSDQESIKTDGSVSNGNYVSSAYAESMSGLIAGGVMKYSLNKHLGFTLSPEYTLFFKKLYEKNDDAVTRFSTRFGVEYNF